MGIYDALGPLLLGERGRGRERGSGREEAFIWGGDYGALEGGVRDYAGEVGFAFFVLMGCAWFCQLLRVGR
jgi:hypothetical protein